MKKILIALPFVSMLLAAPAFAQGWQYQPGQQQQQRIERRDNRGEDRREERRENRDERRDNRRENRRIRFRFGRFDRAERFDRDGRNCN